MIKKEKNGKTNINPNKEENILVFLFIFLVTILIVLLSTIILIKANGSIEIRNLKIKFNKNLNINDDYEVIFKLKIFNKIPVLKLTINKNKIEKNKEFNSKKNLKIERNFSKYKKQILEKLKDIKISELNIKIKLGTENAFFTSMLIPIISSLIAILLRNKMENLKNETYLVEPIYLNQNILEILISGIFEIKMIHIINIIYILTKKEGVKKNERTSNRRSYDYSYE